MSDKDKKVMRRRVLESAIVLVAFILVWIFGNFIAAFLVAVFGAMIVARVNARAPLAIAVVLLVIVPFLLIMDQASAGNRVAEWSYFFLAVGVFLLLVEHLRIAWKSGGDPEATVEPDGEPLDQSRVTK